MLDYIIGSKDKGSFAFIEHTIKDNKITIKEITETKLEFATTFEDEETPRAILKILNKHINQFEDKDYILNLRVFSYEKRIREV